MNAATCATCEHWEGQRAVSKEDGDEFDCVRYPPRVVPQGQLKFPKTASRDRCGEWSAATAARYDGPGLLPPPGDPAWSDLGVNWKGETYIIDGEAYHVR